MSIKRPTLEQLSEIVASLHMSMSDHEVGDYLLVPAVIMQWLFPVIIVLALYLFLRGHDLPGGGFAAVLPSRPPSSCNTWPPARPGSRTGCASCRSTGSD